MRVWHVIHLCDSASNYGLEALLRELDALGCRARLDLAKRRLAIAPPWPGLIWSLHGGLEGIRERYRACLEPAPPTVTQGIAPHVQHVQHRTRPQPARQRRWSAPKALRSGSAGFTRRRGPGAR